jgi:hypothetical protein
MSPITHFLTGWLIANTSVSFTRRERAVITLAAVAPDVDGLGIVAEYLTRNSAHPLTWFSDYHHVVGHNLGFGLATICLAFALTRRRLVAVLAFLSFHSHLLGDLVGSRSPDGYQWPIPYLLPFSSAWQWSWSGQWELNAWPNFAVTGIVLVSAFWLAWQRGYSPLEMVSEAANRAFVNTLRNRFNYGGQNG